jgi:phosphoglycerate dehydrogenase-like enzyme
MIVVVCAPIMGADLTPVRAVDSAAVVIDGNAAFQAYTAARRSGDAAAIRSTEQRMRELLADADVVCMMYPMIDNLGAMAPRLRWLHHTQAGVSNLWSSDVWRASDVTITSGRGHVRPTAIAEYCIAGVLAFARGLHDGHLDKREGRLERTRYSPRRIERAVLGIVGLGGIGSEVARLAKALGMRVLATRRSVESRALDAEGVDVLLPPTELHSLAAQSESIVICTALTRETENLIDRDVLSQTTMQPVLVNISRGEVIDEDAMLWALDNGYLRGAVLDVYAGELERKPPRPELLSHPQVILTPHISGLGGGEDASFMQLFCENLRRHIAGEPLLNLVDRVRGY